MPEIVTSVENSTGSVVTVKLAFVAPAGIVMPDGTRAASLLLLESEMTAPPAGAGPFSVTVPVDEFSPITLDGLSVNDVSAGGSTVSDAVNETPLQAAVMTTVVAVATGLVVTVMLPVVAPAGTVTEAGTPAAAALALDSVTLMPPEGAAPVSVTVPLIEVPPVTLDAFSESDASDAAKTVSDAFRDVLLYVAEIVTVTDVVTGLVVTAKLALVEPPGTVTELGTATADGLLLANGTMTPPLGAGPLRVTVPVAEFPPTCVEELTETDASVING